MNKILDFIKNLFPGKSGTNLVKLYLQDKKCSQKIRVVLRKTYDIQRVYNPDEEAEFKIRKVIVCDNCYNKIKIYVEFDRKYNIIYKEIKNGEYISEMEYKNEK
ncbi:MAG: hypothetical protein ACOCZR_04960 [Halanaerobiales bacterium]